VDDATVLDIAAGTDEDAVDITAQDAAIPDARIFPDGDVTDNLGARSNEGGWVNRRSPIEKFEVWHGFGSVV
jgi:hypothetical protein